MTRRNATVVHGRTGYLKYKCRCRICKKGYAEYLKRRRLQRNKQRGSQKLYPSTTNTTVHDTLTKGQYDRLRNNAS